MASLVWYIKCLQRVGDVIFIFYFFIISTSLILSVRREDNITYYYYANYDSSVNAIYGYDII